MTTIKVGIFNVRLVKAGETWGFSSTLKADKPLIEFYDSRYPHGPHGQLISRYYAETLHGPHGQLISRYYAETLLGRPDEQGLLLDGGSPDWCVTKEDVALVKEFIKKQIKQEKTSTVELTLNESGTLINILMRHVNESGGVHHQPQWVIDLHKKLAVANDKLMHSRD